MYPLYLLDKKGLFSKKLWPVMQWLSEKRKCVLTFINCDDKINWPPARDLKADVSRSRLAATLFALTKPPSLLDSHSIPLVKSLPTIVINSDEGLALETLDQENLIFVSTFFTVKT